MINRIRWILKKIFKHILQVFDDVSLYCEKNRIF